MKTFFKYKWSITIILLALTWTGQILWVNHFGISPNIEKENREWISGFFNVGTTTTRYNQDGTFIAYNNFYPDTKLTPGAIRTTDAKEICTHSTKEVRHTTDAMKREVTQQYGMKWPLGKEWEIDHYVALGIGGADSVDNLWPQPAPEFHWKDAIELKLHNAICKGEITPKEAQEKIKKWHELYQKNSLGGIYPDEEYE